MKRFYCLTDGRDVYRIRYFKTIEMYAYSYGTLVATDGNFWYTNLTVARFFNWLFNKRKK